MKSKKKILKKVLIVFLSLVLLMSASFVAVGLFAPVEWEAAACAGGYRSFAISLNEERIEKDLGIALTDKQLWEIKENWKWEGRNSWSSFSDENGNVVQISGKKIWANYFNWSYM